MIRINTHKVSSPWQVSMYLIHLQGLYAPHAPFSCFATATAATKRKDATQYNNQPWMVVLLP
jgi:hypothetical protein